MLDKTARLDMIDLYNSNLKAVAENIYGGQSVMEEKGNDFLSIRLTGVSQWQMKLFSVNHDTLAVCVHTIASPAQSSTIQGYHRDWHTAKIDFPQPSLEQFFKQKDVVKQSKYAVLIEQLRLAPVAIMLHKNEPTLTYTLSLKSLSVTDQALAAELVKPLTFTWQSGKFVAEKSETLQP